MSRKNQKANLQDDPPKTKRPNKKQKTDSGGGSPNKRGWESWTTEEKERFFIALKDYGRDFDHITERVSTKNYEQVRHFYYRVLKKINNLVKPDSIDKKDQKEILNALLAFWDLKKKYSQKEEYTEGFANSMRDALKQSRTGVLSYEVKPPRSDYDDVNPKLKKKKTKSPQVLPIVTSVVAPEIIPTTTTTTTTTTAITRQAAKRREMHKQEEEEEEEEDNEEEEEEEQIMARQDFQDQFVYYEEPDKLTIQLVPRTKEAGVHLDLHKLNPRLQLTLKSRKPISYIINYLAKKWDGIVEAPIKLYPPKSLIPNHPGWGLEDSISCLDLYLFLGRPDVAKLEYSWSEQKPIVQTISYLNVERQSPKISITVPSKPVVKVMQDTSFRRSTTQLPAPPMGTPIPPDESSISSLGFQLENQYTTPSVMISQEVSNPVPTDDEEASFSIKQMLNTESSNEVPPTPPTAHASYAIEALPTMSLSPLKMADTDSILLPRMYHVNNNAQYSPPSTPSKMFIGNSLGVTSNDLSLYDDISSDGFGNQDKNDELACKTHYKYFEESTSMSEPPQNENITPLQMNSNVQNNRRVFNFRNLF